MYKISFIVPAYNVEKYLEKCILSILNQKHKNYEIIIINDGSTDSTLEIIKKYKKNNKNIKLIDQTNKGLLQSRLNGIKVAKGKYIQFVDSDDWISEKFVEKVYPYIEKGYYDIIKYGMIEEPSKRKIKITNENVDYEKENMESIYKKLIFTTELNNLANELIKKSILDKINFDKFPSSQGEDIFLNLKLIPLVNRMKILPDCYYHYFRNDNSITHQTNIKKIKNHIFDILLVYEEKCKCLKKWGIDSYDNRKQLGKNLYNFLAIKLFMVYKSKQVNIVEINNIIRELWNNNTFCFLTKYISNKDIKDKRVYLNIIKTNIYNKKSKHNWLIKFFAIVSIVHRRIEKWKQEKQ